MTSLKPVRWSYAKTCCPLPKYQNRSWFATIDHHSSRNSKLLLKNMLFYSSTLMDHHNSPFNVSSKKASSMKEEDEEDEDINSQKLDQWVRDSAVEIVNNLGEAPFLVHIYCDGNGSNRDGSTRIKMIKETAIADNWPMIEGRWKRGSGAAPNGVILVEELKTPLVKAKTSDDEMVKISGLNYQSSSSTKLWGILIQGKHKSCTACYLLKTSQVKCVAGLCTHFCLLRVECFFEHADIQLKKLWLQNADGLIST